jgi:hypothetical protein
MLEVDHERRGSAAGRKLAHQRLEREDDDQPAGADRQRAPVEQCDSEQSEPEQDELEWNARRRDHRRAHNKGNRRGLPCC